VAAILPRYVGHTGVDPPLPGSTVAPCGWLERGGTGRGTYWTLSRSLAKRLRPEGSDRQQTRIDWEAAKTRILSILKQRAKAAEPGLSNAELRKITAFNRDQVNRLMRELRQQHPEIQMIGDRKASRYHYDLQ
jgi:ATP-dependent DNA helicase RecG